MPASRISLPLRRRRPSTLAGDTRGATAVEYGLIVALIVITMIASFKLVASGTIAMWGNVQTRIGNATGN